MAARIEAPEVVIPSGTLDTAPITQDLDWQPGVVRRVEILVPPGPSGLIGFRIGHSGQTIIPRTAGQWIIPGVEVIFWDLDGYPTGGAWFVEAYNLDIYDHTLYTRWLLDEIDTTGPQPFAVLDIEQPDQPAPSIEDTVEV